MGRLIGFLVALLLPAFVQAAEPSIVQTANARGNSSPITLTWGATPTSGNLMIAIVAGYNQTLSVPTGWTLVSSTNNGINNAIWVYKKVAGASEPTSTNWTGASDWHNIMLWELTHYSGNITYTGQNAGLGGIQTSSLSAAANPSRTIRYLIQETDGGVGYTSITPTNNLLPNGTFAASGNHVSTFQSLSASATGAQALIPDDASYPVWVDLKLEGASVAPTENQRTFARGTGSLTFTQAGTPTNGDQMFIVMAGGSGDTWNTPSGWSLVFNANDNSFQRTIVYSKTAGASEPSSVTVTRASGTNYWGGMWVDASASTLTTAHGAGGTTTTLYYTMVSPGSPNTPPYSGNYLDLRAYEQDTAFSVSSPSSGATIVSPAGWNPPASGNHGAFYMSVDSTGRGKVAYATGSASLNSSVAASVAIEYGSSGAGSTTPMIFQIQ